MKITFIVEGYYPKISGVPNVVKYLAEGLAKKKHEVTIITRYIENQKEEEIYNNVNIIRVKNINRNILKKYVGNCKDYINYILSRDDDVTIIECCQAMTTDILLKYLTKIKGVKILHTHGLSGLTYSLFDWKGTIKNTIGNTYNYIFWKIYYKFILPKYINDFDAIMSLCETDSSIKFLDKYYNKDRYVLGNAADDQFFQKLKRNGAIEKYTEISGEGYFLSVANYSAYKNQIGILKQYYKCKNINFDMVFIGSQKNKYYKKLLKINDLLEKKYNKKVNVHFLTSVDRKDILFIMQNAKLYLVGSKYEEYSISIIETISQGVPFISTDVGNAKLLPGGITVDNISKMHKAIENLLKDNNKYQELSESGRKYANEYCKISNAVEKLENIIKKEIEKRK